MYLCWEIGAIDLMITIDDVSFWFIWTQNWDSWHGAHKLDNSLGEMMMLLYFDSLFFCRSRIFLQYGNIILCMLQPKSYVLLGCSGRIFSTDIRSVDHPKPLYFNLLIYFASSCANPLFIFLWWMFVLLKFCGYSISRGLLQTAFKTLTQWQGFDWRILGTLAVDYARYAWSELCTVDDVDVFCTGKCCITIKDVFHI